MIRHVGVFVHIETKVISHKNQTLECSDDTFSVFGSPSSYTTSRLASQCSRTANHSPSLGIHNSTSSVASISSSVSNSQEESLISISPVNDLINEAPMNSLTISGALSNNCETAPLNYPPSHTTSWGKCNNSYATDPLSIPTPDTLLNDRHSSHTPLAHIASGEKLVLTTVDNGAEPLGINVSPSSSPRYQCGRSLSPRTPRQRQTSPVVFQQPDPVEEAIPCKYDKLCIISYFLFTWMYVFPGTNGVFYWLITLH